MRPAEILAGEEQVVKGGGRRKEINGKKVSNERWDGGKRKIGRISRMRRSGKQKGR